MFKGFLHRAKEICSRQHLQEEITFLIDVFVENGYKRQVLERIANPNNNRPRNTQGNKNMFVSLPYVPGIDKKLKKVFSKAGLNVVYKSGRNLESVLSNRNKPKLSPNSCPGCYRIPCHCGANYIGETKKRAVTRFEEHEKAIFKGLTSDSALSEHALKSCDKGIDWENSSTICTEPRYFKRCIREALEIQREESNPKRDTIINRESGKYVTTRTWLNIFDKINDF